MRLKKAKCKFRISVIVNNFYSKNFQFHMAFFQWKILKMNNCTKYNYKEQNLFYEKYEFYHIFTIK